jgi:hypothetical protein
VELERLGGFEPVDREPSGTLAVELLNQQRFIVHEKLS